MSLIVGTRLGPYEIIAPLGSGGMGEVYRAKDTKLDREVAIKVMPASMAADRERLARFEREAKVLASLNHPNIAQIYGLEDNALVMELVPGQTLAVPQPLEKALHYARQIAEALEAAHEKGITHRDLKPANIMITPEGTVKVLDFGLASVPSREASTDPENSPTLTMAATQAGMIMGTAAYMSPEQAAGKPVDKRSDIWSFGVVLYEMLAGKKLFDGETLSHTLADVLRAPIDFGKLPASTPASIVELVSRCLERDVKKRLQAVGEARIAIQRYQAHPTAALPPVAPARTGWPWKVAAAAFALGLAALAVIHFRESAAEVPLARYAILPPDQASLDYYGGHGHAVISPDGRQIALTATSREGKRQIWLRGLAAETARPLPGTENASLPFWSPDSRYLGFFADRKLRKIDITGGTSLTLCEATNGRGGAWSPHGVIVFAPTPATALYQVSEAGGIATPVTVLDPQRGVTSHRFPYFLPDGKHFLFRASSTTSTALPVGGIQVGSLDGAKSDKSLVETGTNEEPLSSAAYAQGYLLYTRQSTLFAQPFDDRRLVTSGNALPLAERVAFAADFAEAAFSVSSTGLMVFHSGEGESRVTLAWFDRTGKQTGRVGETGAGQRLAMRGRISPDGQRIAFSIRQWAAGSRNIWVYDLQKNSGAAILTSTANEDYPVWSPDGRVIAFSSIDGVQDLFRMPRDGSGKKDLLYKDGRAKYSTSWSPDGRFLLFNSVGTSSEIQVLPLTGERKPWPLFQTSGSKADGQFSPDGQWVAYRSDESGRNEIYVSAFVGQAGGATSRKIPISTGGGTMVRWRGDGKELFYLAPDRTLMAADVNWGTGAPMASAPRALFGPLLYGDFDVTPDGQRFLTTIPLKSNIVEPLAIIQNWPAALRR